jgi:hypothetical protein
MASGFVLYTSGELFLLFLLITKGLKNLIAIKRNFSKGENDFSEIADAQYTSFVTLTNTNTYN